MKPLEKINVPSSAYCFGHYLPHEDKYYRLSEFNEHGFASVRMHGFNGGWAGVMHRDKWQALKEKANC